MSPMVTLPIVTWAAVAVAVVEDGGRAVLLSCGAAVEASVVSGSPGLEVHAVAASHAEHRIAKWRIHIPANDHPREPA